MEPDILEQTAAMRVAVWKKQDRSNELEKTPVKVSLYHPSFGPRVPYVHVSREDARKFGEALIKASYIE